MALPPADGPQHPFESDHRRHAVWQLEDPEHTNVIALWPDDTPPSRMEVLAAFANAAGESVKVLDDVGEHSPDFEWASIVEVPGFERPMAVWTERARPMSPEELEVAGGVQCPWIVGVEAMLEVVDPLRDFAGLVRLMLRGLPDAPAMLDVTTSRWSPRSVLEALFEHESVEPPADVLWVVEARRKPAEDGADDEGIWLRTRGLGRCGRPELEMIGVPDDTSDSAAVMLNGLCSMLFEAEPPHPGEPWQVGHEIRVALIPADVIVDARPDEALGGTSIRDRFPTTPSAVVCDVDDDAPVVSPAWPETGLDLMDQSATHGLFWTERATRRQSDLARAGWDQFATAWAAVRQAGVHEGDDPPALFGLKAGCAIEGRPELNHEHVWFRVHGFSGHQVDAELVNDPVHSVGITRGERMQIAPDRVADWVVVTRDGSYGPADLEAMWTAIDRLRHRAVPAEDASAVSLGGEPSDGE
ncbi:MAG: DUF2314 domain-containing protein [Phycisphaerales bacterium]